MVEFICNRSGNKVRFTRPEDIESMRKQVGYTEVINESQAKNDAQADARKENGQSIVDSSCKSEIRKEDERKEVANVLKKRGRPPKNK